MKQVRDIPQAVKLSVQYQVILHGETAFIGVTHDQSVGTGALRKIHVPIIQAHGSNKLLLGHAPQGFNFAQKFEEKQPTNESAYEEEKFDAFSPSTKSYSFLLSCQDHHGAFADPAFIDFYLSEYTPKEDHPEMLMTVYLTIMGVKVLREHFASQRDEWLMVDRKAMQYLKRKHSLDDLAIERLIESF